MDIEPVPRLTNKMIMQNKYDIKILEQNIEHLDHKTLLCFQVLTAEFCVEHILDLDIESGNEDSYIFDKIYIMNNQLHITDDEWDKAYKKFYVDNK